MTVKPHYADDAVTLHHGDALDVLRSLPAASVDAVVTDPPYGLEFMGKDWDSFKAPTGGAGFESDGMGKGFTALPNFGGNPNPTCRNCRGMKRGQDRPGFTRCRCDAPDFPNVGLKQSRAFGQWCEQWAAECLRVLKPGGYLLAFGGTRTVHRLTTGVEDAGFEIRDGIDWLYGSGFPKSLNLGDGQGTALKPAREPIVVARKPLAAPAVNVLSKVESELRHRGVTGEIRWTNEPASDAAPPVQQPSSSSTAQPPAAGTSAVPVDESATANAARPTAIDSAPSTPLGALPTPIESPTTAASLTAGSATPSSTPTDVSAPAAASDTPTSSPSTTSTVAAPPTDEPPTARSITSSGARDSLPDIESFAGIATGLTGSRTHVRIDRLADGTFIWPAGLPTQTSGGGTVAGNVLAYGTGALNIDACRVGDEQRTIHAGGASSLQRVSRVEQGYRATVTTSVGEASIVTGRWPSNVVLSHAPLYDDQGAITGDACADGCVPCCPVAELDAQSGVLTSGTGAVKRASAKGGERSASIGAESGAEGTPMLCYGDSGGASRFFPVFRYEAKAPTSERPRTPDGTAHPTVKPLDLMRWLVRLVTPAGGVVLEPFTGSGTTAEACVLEGFRCIAIEREAAYLPLITARLTKPLQPALDFGAVA